MFRKLVVAMGLAFLVGSVAGCGGSSGAGGTKPAGDKGTVDKLKEGAKEGAAAVGEKASEVGAKAKEAVIKPMTDLYPKIEEKIKAMSGDAGKTASEKFEAFKKMVEDFKTSDKWEGLKDGLLKQFEELKKMVGL